MQALVLTLKKPNRAALLQTRGRPFHLEKEVPMDFFRIINAALNILAWLIVLAVVYAVFPYFQKLFSLVDTMHRFGQ